MRRCAGKPDGKVFRCFPMCVADIRGFRELRLPVILPQSGRSIITTAFRAREMLQAYPHVPAAVIAAGVC